VRTPTADPLPSLWSLRAFKSVAETGSVSRGAAQILRAPSTLTRSIRELESHLGVELFERKPRGMLLTEFGNVVLLRAQQAEGELLAAWQDIVEMAFAADCSDRSSVLHALFDCKRLAVLIDLVDHRHMPTVAALRGISQPGISMHVRSLEQALGTRLFERTARGLRPTSAASLLASRARRAIAILDLIRQDISLIQGCAEGCVRVGALPLGRAMILPTAIARLIAKYPRLKVMTVESPYESLVKGLRDAEIDFVLGALRPSSATPDLSTEALFTDDVSLVARQGHPLTAKHPVSIKDLDGVGWVMSRVGAPTCKLFAAMFERLGHRAPTPAVETGDLAILRSLLIQSDLVTVLSSYQLFYELQDERIARLDFDCGDVRREIGIIRSARSTLSAAAASLISEIRAVAREIPCGIAGRAPSPEEAAGDGRARVETEPGLVSAGPELR